MRFLADENVSSLVIGRLRANGVEVASMSEMTPGASDIDILEIAAREDRILITEDRDFGELLIRQRQNVQGVILLELDRLSNEAEAELVATVVSANADKLCGNLLVIEPGRVRIRPLAL